jgi:hypothetical protein
MQLGWNEVLLDVRDPGTWLKRLHRVNAQEFLYRNGFSVRIYPPETLLIVGVDAVTCNVAVRFANMQGVCEDNKYRFVGWNRLLRESDKRWHRATVAQFLHWDDPFADVVEMLYASDPGTSEQPQR